MKRSILAYVVLAVAFVAIVVLAIAGDSNTRARFSFASTYDGGPHGYLALFNVLDREHVRVERFERELGVLDPTIGTLVISANDADLIAGKATAWIDKNDAKRLTRFVERGGRLVFLARRLGAPLRAAFDLHSDLSADVGSILLPPLRLSMMTGVRRVDAEDAPLYSFASFRRALPLLGERRGIAAFVQRRGRGTIVVISAPDIFSNGLLAHADNARFAFDLLAGHGLVAFDERLHGYAQDKSFWDALPQTARIAIWIVGAMLALWLIDANLPGIPVVAVDGPDERNSSAYIMSMATLLRRARAGSIVISRFSEAARRAGAARRKQRGSAAALLELDRLAAMNHPTDSALLRAARIYASLRKDLG